MEHGRPDIGHDRHIVDELESDHVRKHFVAVGMEGDAGVVDVAVRDVVDVATGTDGVQPAAVAGDGGRDCGVQVDIGEGRRSNGLLLFLLFGLLLRLLLFGLLLHLSLLSLLLRLLFDSLLLLLLLSDRLRLVLLLLLSLCSGGLGIVVIVAAADEREARCADSCTSATA